MVEELGSDGFVYGTAVVNGEERNIVVRVGARDRIQKGQTLTVAVDPTHLHLFDAATGDRLN